MFTMSVAQTPFRGLRAAAFQSAISHVPLAASSHTAVLLIPTRSHLRRHVPRFYSSSSAAAQRREDTEPLVQARRASSSVLGPPDPEAANPPYTTRPPPLELPQRTPGTWNFSHVFATGKAYLSFYKTGLKRIWTNTKLVRARDAPPLSQTESKAPAGSDGAILPFPPRRDTRAHHLLHARWKHDMRRLPVFALLLVICGELTPLVVLAIPGVVPMTCRIPRQVEKLQKQAEARRAASFEDFLARRRRGGGEDEGVAVSESATLLDASGRDLCHDRSHLAHVGRVIGAIPRIWDRLGLDPPTFILRPEVLGRIMHLIRDDELLMRAGGVEALEAEEMRLACAERGINTLGRNDADLAEALAAWLEVMDKMKEHGQAVKLRRTLRYLAAPESAWREQR